MFKLLSISSFLFLSFVHNLTKAFMPYPRTTSLQTRRTVDTYLDHHTMAAHSLGDISSRRCFFQASLSLLFYPILVQAIPAEEYPDIEYLEPLFELEVFVYALQEQLGNPKVTNKEIKDRLDYFFDGDNISYATLGENYLKQIQYDEDELAELIQVDREARRRAINGCIERLENLRRELGKEVPDQKILSTSINMAAVDINRFFSLVMDQDERRAAIQLFFAARRADKNGDGIIDGNELSSLSLKDRNIWERRVKLVGK